MASVSPGYAGVKGFGGGFDRSIIRSFGERPVKQFLAATAREVRKLDRALCALGSEITVVLMYYAPVVQSRVQGSRISLLDEMRATPAELSMSARTRGCPGKHIAEPSIP